MSTTDRTLRLIVNGKAAADLALRQAVGTMRDRGFKLEVRVTWEGGDAARYAAEAAAEGIDVVIAAGGDGTINEVVSGLVQTDNRHGTAVAAIPYGTANDFATSTGIPLGDPLAALQLAFEGNPTPIDVGRINDRFFVNVATGGFGAEVTATTPPAMKKALGGAAYSLMGLVTALKMSPYGCRVEIDDRVEEGQMIVMAVGNGRQAGGGFQLTPHALLNDGLLDFVVVHDVDIAEMGVVMSELIRLDSPANKYVHYVQTPRLRILSDQPLQLNLDGEPMRHTDYKIDVLPGKVSFVLPSDTALLKPQ